MYRAWLRSAGPGGVQRQPKAAPSRSQRYRTRPTGRTGAVMDVRVDTVCAERTSERRGARLGVKRAAQESDRGTSRSELTCAANLGWPGRASNLWSARGPARCDGRLQAALAWSCVPPGRGRRRAARAHGSGDPVFGAGLALVLNAGRPLLRAARNQARSGPTSPSSRSSTWPPPSPRSQETPDSASRSPSGSVSPRGSRCRAPSWTCAGPAAAGQRSEVQLSKQLPIE
jgi:hypothetical protein